MYYTKKAYDPAVAERKAKNEKIFKETTADIQRGWYKAPSGHAWTLDTKTIDEGSRCYHEELPPVTCDRVPGGTRIVVLGEDCLVTAERLVGRDYNPALLNFASGGHPGGGVERGSRAQEETICRRSTLTRSIFTFDAKYAKRYGYPHHEGANYPLDNLDFSAIYSPGVTVFREGKECTYMEHPYSVAVITCAALNLNGTHRLKLTPDKRMPEEAVAITLNKVRTIFRIALLHGHDSLVLGAFGCGAFKNPPDQVAAIFHEVLEETEFKDRFRVVTFSIIEDHNSKNRNLNAFQQEFAETTPKGPEPAHLAINRTSYEEKQAEAVERMRHIGINEKYIKALEQGEIMVYDPNEEPELIEEREDKEIQLLEKRYGMFVWGVLRDNEHNEDWVDGDPVNVYLFVWDNPERWAEEREALYEMKPIVYVSFANPEDVDGFYTLDSVITLHKNGYPVI